MNGKKLTIGLAGCGHLGGVHAKLLSEICSVNRNCTFSGVYDIDKDKASRLSEQFKTKSFDTLEELLNSINTLILVTTTSAHFELAAKAIEKDINVFIEKPVTANSAEALELRELAKNKTLKIQVGHVERFNPALVSLSRYMLNPLFIESHRLAQFNPRGTDVSVIQDLMIHDLDIVFNIVKSPIARIDANGVAVISDNIDIANARITFDSGCVANLTASRISLKKMRKMRIFQQNAYISVDFGENKSEVFRLVDSSDSSFKGTESYPLSDSKKLIYEQPEPESNDINPIRDELESFFDSILNDKTVIVTLDEASRAVEASDRIIDIISETLKRIKTA